jgi:hypothetical protein
MSDKSLKPFDAAALVGQGDTVPADASAEAASGLPADQAGEIPGAAAAQMAVPAFVTREDLLAILDEQGRRIQSSLDKRDRNLQKLLAQQQAQDRDRRILEVAQASGVVIPPDRQAAFLKALTEQELLGGNGQDEGSPQSSVLSRQSDGEETDPVTAQGYALAEMYGLTGEDPEAAEIRNDSAQGYLASIVLAGQKKLARLARAQNPNPAAMPGLGPGGGPAPGRNPLAKISSPGTLYGLAAKEAKQRAGKR